MQFSSGHSVTLEFIAVPQNPRAVKVFGILPAPLTPIKKISPITSKKKKLENIELLAASFTMSSMITTTAWVRRGVAAQFPTKYEIDEEEMSRISKLARMQLEEAKEGLSAAQDEAMDEDDKEEESTEDAGEKKESTSGAGSGSAPKSTE